MTTATPLFNPQQHPVPEALAAQDHARTSDAWFGRSSWAATAPAPLVDPSFIVASCAAPPAAAHVGTPVAFLPADPPSPPLLLNGIDELPLVCPAIGETTDASSPGRRRGRGGCFPHEPAAAAAVLDKKAAQKLRNRLSAQHHRDRQKKLLAGMKAELQKASHDRATLQWRVSTLEAENATLKLENEQLRAEIDTLTRQQMRATTVASPLSASGWTEAAKTTSGVPPPLLPLSGSCTDLLNSASTCDWGSTSTSADDEGTSTTFCAGGNGAGTLISGMSQEATPVISATEDDPLTAALENQWRDCLKSPLLDSPTSTDMSEATTASVDSLPTPHHRRPWKRQRGGSPLLSPFTLTFFLMGILALLLPSHDPTTSTTLSVRCAVSPTSRVVAVMATTTGSTHRQCRSVKPRPRGLFPRAWLDSCRLLQETRGSSRVAIIVAT